jgi:hypothetical protein
MQELEELFQEVLAQLPSEPEANITLDGANCPRPPDEIVARQLKVVASPQGHSYGDSARYDLVHFFVDKDTYRRLGLLLFASVFHPNRQITLYPRHPDTTVTKIRIECGVTDPSCPKLSGLANTPAAYGYYAAPAGHRHPLSREEWRIEGHHGKCFNRAEYCFPFLELTNEHGGCGSEDEFKARSVVTGFGSPEATVTLGALLLDIGLPQTELTEFCLESPSGNWSVEIGSAEARLWVGYDYH